MTPEQTIRRGADVEAEAGERFDWNKVGIEVVALTNAIAETIDPSNPMQTNEATMECLEYLWNEGYRVVPRDVPATDTLDAAWAAVEQLIVERGPLYEVRLRHLPGAGSVASVFDKVTGEEVGTHGPTPIAALRALADALTPEAER